MRTVAVPSLTKPGTFWDVSEDESGMECACPAFDFSTRDEKGCKHIEIVKTADAMILRCFEEHGPSGGGLCRTCVVALLALTAGKIKRNYMSKDEVKERIAKVKARKGLKKR